MLKKLFTKIKSKLKKEEKRKKPETILSTEWFLTNIPSFIANKDDVRKIKNFITYIDAHISDLDYLLFSQKTTPEERLLLSTIIANSIKTYLNYEMIQTQRMNLFLANFADKFSEETVLRLSDYSIKRCLEIKQLVDSYNNLILEIRK